jgi:methionyl-tRNA formyltransferase
MADVILLGKGALCIRVLRWFLDSPSWQVSAVVPVIPEPEWTESLVEQATARGVPLVDSGDYHDLPGGSADLALSVFYDRILSAEFIASHRRVLNLHNSPLPKYRGVAPINWALKNGEHTHGVTLHEVTPGIDDGPIVAQVVYSLYPFDEVEDVYRRGLAFGWTLFEQTMPILDRIEARQQDETAASYYPRSRSAELGERAGWRR